MSLVSLGLMALVNSVNKNGIQHKHTHPTVLKAMLMINLQLAGSPIRIPIKSTRPLEWNFLQASCHSRQRSNSAQTPNSKNALKTSTDAC